jgi:hypothetical protein
MGTCILSDLLSTSEPWQQITQTCASVHGLVVKAADAADARAAILLNPPRTDSEGRA